MNANRASVFLVAAVIVLSQLAGCMSVSVRAGRKPDVHVLEQSLKVGESNKAEVLRALGEPFGTGRGTFGAEWAPHDILTYYYETSTMKDSRRVFLWVFLDGDRYDGYMWYSSLEEATASKEAQRR